MICQVTELTAPGRVELAQRPVGRLKKYECRVRVAFCGVCGTDLAIHSGSYPVPLPLTLGHEFSGVVEAVGHSDHEALVGRAVTGEINNTCLARGQARPCGACRAGRPHHCSQRTVVGIIRHPGAFAETITLPARCVHVLPRGMSLQAGALIEPLAAALQTFEKSPLRAGETVVVLGAGRLGALVALVADRLGARTLAFCRSEARRQWARPLGIAVEIGTDADAIVQRVERFTKGQGADLVVEATGDSDMTALALRLVRPEGRIALKSTPGAPARDLDLTRAVVDEITFQGSRCGPFDKAIAFARRHRVDLDGLITAVYPLDRLSEAFAAARQGGKVLVAMGPGLGTPIS